jgi:hypothetical protein
VTKSWQGLVFLFHSDDGDDDDDDDDGGGGGGSRQPVSWINNCIFNMTNKTIPKIRFCEL